MDRASGCAHDFNADSSTREFVETGACTLRGVFEESVLCAVEHVAATWTSECAAPIERESDVGYPGAPRADETSEVARPAIRRYLQVYQRDPLFRTMLLESSLLEGVARLLGTPPILVLAHHNCLMTKEPRHSSDTPWHRDLRYWAYEEGNLISAWVALGEEYPACGGLRIVPGSHRRELSQAAYDSEQALRTATGPGARTVQDARPVILGRGDVLLFHCRLLHTASRNFEDHTKRSLVFTFRGESDTPLPGTRSARGGEVEF